MPRSSFTYLATCYSHPDPEVRVKRFERAAREAARLMMAGEIVFCPIAHSHPIELMFPSTEGQEFWMKQDLPILRCATKLKVLCTEGWEQSEGVATEIELAEELGIPTEYIIDQERS